MPNWSDFLAALGGFGAGASQSIGQGSRRREDMEFQQEQQDRLFGQQERLQTRGFQQQTALETMREAARNAAAATRGTVPIAGLPDVFRREFQTPPPESDLMRHAIEEAGRPGTQPISRPQVREPERVDERVLGPLGTILGQRETRAAKPGYSVEDLTKMFQGGGQGGLEMETRLPIAGGGEASFKRPRQERPPPMTDFSNATALVRSRTPGLPADPNQWPPEALESVRGEVAKLSGARGEQRIILGGSPEATAAASRLTAAQTRGRKQVGLEYLPAEVRARAQEQINVATDSANVAAVAKKIEAEATARTGGGPLDADTRQVVGAMQSAIAVMAEMRKEFTPEQRKEFVGVLQNPALRAMQFLKGDPQFARFQALLGRLKKAAFEDAGKQMTPFEFSVVQQYVPQGTELSWEDFEAKLEMGTAYSEMIIGARRQFAGTTKGGFAREGVPQPALTAPGARNPARPSAPGKPPGRRYLNPTTGKSGYWDATTGTWTPE